GVVGDHHHLRADLPAVAAAVRHRPAVLRHPGGLEPADELPYPADGDVGLLSEGNRPAACAVDADIQGCDAVPLYGVRVHGHDLHLPRYRLPPAPGVLWPLGKPRAPIRSSR